MSHQTRFAENMVISFKSNEKSLRMPDVGLRLSAWWVDGNHPPFSMSIQHAYIISAEGQIPTHHVFKFLEPRFTLAGSVVEINYDGQEPDPGAPISPDWADKIKPWRVFLLGSMLNRD